MPDGFRDGLRIDVGRLPHHRGIEVVGVVDDASVLTVRDAAPRVIYLSTLQQPAPFARWPGLIVRTASSAHDVSWLVTRAVEALGHEFLVRTDTLSGYITRSLARERLLAAIAMMYGSLALAMVGIGLWALLAPDVTRRLREFGVRLSLGASPAMLHRSITFRAIRLTAAGTALGTVVAWMLTRAVTATVGINDEAVSSILAGVVALLLLIALCAAMGPARRAARTEPMVALRSE